MNNSDEIRALAPEKGKATDLRLLLNEAHSLATTRLGKAVRSIATSAMHVHEYRNLHRASLYRALCNVDSRDCR